MEDIREALRMESQLRHAQRLEAVGLLAGGIAHDFNNLLTVILGEVEFVQIASTPDESEESLNAIQNAAQRAALLTRQLLTFSRRQLVDPKPVDLNRVIDALHQMIARLIGEDIQVELRLGAVASSVIADVGQLEQIVMNLVINARDAMPVGGTLVLQTSEEQRETPEPGTYVVLTVRDTGVGMTGEVRARIFDAFFTTKGPGQGTGLGLATCQDIVARAGGWIEVDSTPGQGTVMRVYLPRTTEIAPAAPDRNASIPHGTETILLVEDDAGVRAVAVRMLAPLGYTVIATENGDQALTMLTLHQRTVDLLLTDLVLPGMSGRVVAERALQLVPDLRVLFASGYTDDVIVQRQLLEHGASFLQKPFTPRALGEKVREVLDRP
jgi:two-component system, cell cycle sensor histidine kinase and response regulator CckA